MIARIAGTVVEKQPTELVVDCQGVGYALLVSVATAESAMVGKTIVLHTHLAVREDAMQLFGFRSLEERRMFLHLTSISGIGGKTAMAVLSSAELHTIRSAVLQKNSAFLQRLPGVGKKTAERIILELTDKLRADAPSEELSGLPASMTDVHRDAIAAMVALGYQRNQAEKAVARVLSTSTTQELSTDAVLRAALQFMM